MHKTVLRWSGRWEPIEKAVAKRLGLNVAPFAPTHRASEFGLVLDRSIWFEASIAPRWRVAMRLANQRGQPVIAEVRVFPDEPGTRPPGRWSGNYGALAVIPPGGVTARVLRMIRTQAFRRDLFKIRSRWPDELRQLEAIAPSVPPPPAPSSTTRGRKGRSDRELARMASTYAGAWLAGRPPIPAVAIAHRLSLGQARDAVSRARVRSLLTPASKQGKGGGQLTERARELLKVKKQ
jgi:hypothetical protein